MSNEKHPCAVPRCPAFINTSSFMCTGCWSKVPKILQAEVIASARARGEKMGPSWAPWVRAKAKAVAAVFPWTSDASKELWLSHQLAVAGDLEAKC